LLHKILEKPSESEKLSVTFLTPENEAIQVFAKPGSNLLDIAHNNDIELEGKKSGQQQELVRDLWLAQLAI
jgi:hypothetical protein